MIKETVKSLALEHIRLDPKLQMRDCIDQDHVDRLAEVLADGKEFDGTLPIVYQDGTTNWLADGWHRHGAHGKAGVRKMKCLVRQGTFHDAFIYALSANSKHGLRRTNADKMRAIDAALDYPKLMSESDRLLGQICGVSHSMVGDRRRSRTATEKPDSTGAELQLNQKRVGADGKVRDVSNISKANNNRKKKTPDELELPLEKQAALTQSVEALLLQYPDVTADDLAGIGGVSVEFVQHVRAAVRDAATIKAIKEHLTANPTADDSATALFCQTTAQMAERVRSEMLQAAAAANLDWQEAAEESPPVQAEAEQESELPAILQDDPEPRPVGDVEDDLQKAMHACPTGVRDAKKRPVPANLVEAFKARTELKALISRYGTDATNLQKSKHGVPSAGLDPHPGYAWMPTQHIQKLIDDLQRTIRFSMPWIVCPQCGGEGKFQRKPCGICKAQGFLPEDAKNGLPAELVANSELWTARGDAYEGVAA